MRILVTGGTGFVGGHLLPLLRQQQHELYVLVHHSGQAMREGDYKICAVDLLDARYLNQCVAEIRPEAVIHLAAVSNVMQSWKDPDRTVEVNIRGTLNLLEAVHIGAPAARFLYVGSSDAYGLTAKRGVSLTEEMACRPQNPYAISKFAAEQLVWQLGKSYGMQVLCTRSFNHFGPGQAQGFVIADFASQIANIECGWQAPVLHVGNLEAQRDFTYVDDIVRAYAMLIEQDVASGIYNICSGQAHSMQEMLDILCGLSHVRIRIAQDSERMRPSEVPIFVGNAAKLRRATGWMPRMNLREGLRHVLDFWRKKMAIEEDS